MSYIRSMGVKQVKDLLDVAMEAEEKELIFRYYLAIFPQMDKKTYTPFNEYYEKNRSKASIKADTRSQEEIMQEILSIKI